MTTPMTTATLAEMDDKALRAHLRAAHYATPEQQQVLRLSLANVHTANGADFRQSVEAMGIEELEAAFAHFRNLYTRSVVRYAQDHRMRPASFTANRLTRSEGESLVMLRNNEQALAFIALFLVGRRNQAKAA